MTAARPPLDDLGVSRALQTCLSPAGFFTVLALDHPASFVLGRPSADEPTDDERSEAIAAKWDLVRALAPHASAVLLDPQLSLPYAVATGVLPGDVGLICNAETEAYQRVLDPATFTELRPGWTPEKAKLAGAAGWKLLWRYRHELPSAPRLRAGVRQVAEDCRRWSLPLIVEPIWVPLPGEDLADADVRAARARAVVEYALVAQELGADVVKTEFPGWVGTPAQRDEGAKACAEIDAGLDVPWLLLSGGLAFEEFVVQCEIAARAGASGFIAGRAVWDCAASPDPQARAAGLGEAVERLRRLGEAFERLGRPFGFGGTSDEARLRCPEDWYVDWHATAEG